MTIERIYHWACKQPEATALIWNGFPLSYAAFWRMIEGARRFFAAQNLPIGGTAIVQINHLVHAWVTVMGLRATGLNTINVVSKAEAEKLALKNVVCIVLSPAEPGPSQSGDNFFSQTVRITIPHTIFSNARSGNLAFNPQDLIPFGGHILYTSGTTGGYKKVMMSGAEQEKRNVARAQTWLFDRHTIHHGVDFPLYTGVGFKHPSAIWHTGGCVLFDQSAEKYSHFFQQGITSTALVPSMLQILLKSGVVPTVSSQEFKLVVSAGFLSLGLAEHANRQLTRKIEIRYTATELGTYALHSSFNSLDDLHWMNPADDRIVQIVDDNGIECPVGEEGKLRILTTDIDCTEYLDDKEATENVFRDGFFYSGDLAIRRADGRIRILGRTVDVLNVQGNKVAVAPLEQKIQQMLGVDEVCLFSGLNAQGREELVVVIESDRLPPKPDLEAVASEFSTFERVRFSVLKEFPRSEMGTRKIQRSALRKFVFSKDIGLD
ncbi:MAG: AMP-binding protein [Methylophilales bacterium]|nr:AMP-binding protein [Methylophilales bacterium]